MMKIRSTLICGLTTGLSALLLTSVSVSAQNWPQWRGPNGNGVADPGRYPAVFSATNDVLWSAPLPGKGGSTPAVGGDRIALTSGVGEGTNGLDGVLCFDWEGKQLWQVTLGAQRPGKHRRGSGSCPSPVTDGERILVNFKGRVWCLDLPSGRELWSAMLPSGKGAFYSSPVLAGDTLYFCREEGSVYVARITPAGLRLLNETRFDDVFVASPVLVHGRLLLRGEKNLFCVGK